MYRYIAIASIVLTMSLCSPAQSTVEHGWSDKNNTDQYAAYMASVAYFEHGYMAATVQVRNDGARRIFEVNPGPVYHFKDVQVIGVQLPEKLMSAAPKLGEVYSATRVNEWAASIKKQDHRLLRMESTYDHARAEVAVKVIFDHE